MNTRILCSLLYADGQTVPEIALQTGFGPETVHTYIRHTKRLYRRAGRAQAFDCDKLTLRRLLVEDGLLQPV